jgi:hypothetical protein
MSAARLISGGDANSKIRPIRLEAVRKVQERGGQSPFCCTEADILSEIIAPDQPTMPEASAREILTLRFNQQAIQRMNDLAEKNRRGELLAVERELLRSTRGSEIF